MKSLISAMTLGFTVVVSILAPTLIGLAADKFCGIGPWGVVMGIICGALCAFGALWRPDKNEIRKTYA